MEIEEVKETKEKTWACPPKLHKLEPGWKFRSGFASWTKTGTMTKSFGSRLALRPSPNSRHIFMTILLSDWAKLTNMN